MRYNTLIGNSLDTNKTLIFNQMENEQCYLSFGRETESWGNCALVNISLKNNIDIKDVISFGTHTNKFVDRDVTSFQESEIYIHIYKTSSNISDFSDTDLHYTRIEELTTVDLKLCHINSNWAVIKGLPYNFSEFLNNNQNEKFYIIRNSINFYSLNPNNLQAIAKINIKSDFNSNSIDTNCNLKLVNNGAETDCIYYLTTNTNILGEIFINGLLEENFNIAESNLIDLYSIYNNSAITLSTPYFTLYNSTLKYKNILSKMYLIKYQEESVDKIWYTSDTEQYLLFKVVDQNNQIYYIKISKSVTNSGLAIYNETLPFYNTTDKLISDLIPPDFDCSYLKTQSLHTSLFDIKGLVKIKKSNLDYGNENILYSSVAFAKEINSNVERTTFENLGFSELNPTNSIQQLQITSDEFTVHYGNINRNQKSVTGNYTTGVSRIYLYNNHKFVLGDIIQIRYWNEDHTVYNPLQTQTKNSLDEDLTVVGISYELDNSYIDINGVTTQSINFNESSPDEATSDVDAAIISNSTNIVQNKLYAVCTKINDAYKYNMDSVMVDLKVPYNIPEVYSGLYRQLSICCNPKFRNNNTMQLCTEDYYTTNLFDSINHKYDLGTILFLSNKKPIYRKFINDKEVFKIIF